MKAQRTLLASLLLLGGSLMLAEAAPPQRGITFSPDDPRLEWGPCPEVMPAGCQLAVLQGDPAEENADVLLRTPPRSSLPRHYHTSAERMVLVSGRLRIDYDGQPPLELTEGSYAYGPAKLPHSAHCVSDEPCYLFIAFEGPVDAIPTEGPRRP